MMFDWIPYLWALQWAQPVWLIGCLITACLGFLGIGVLYEAFKDEALDELVPMCTVIAIAWAVVAVFWPIVLIGLPFIVSAGGLFFGGRHIAKTVKERV